MSEASNPESHKDYSPEAARAAVERILSSRTFRSAETQRKFLRYAAAEAIAGRRHLIKEYVIATEALGRGDSFDPRLDPIVRTEARKLRARLAKYYATEGAADRLRIDFPKGSYAPVFLSVDPLAVEVAEVSSVPAERTADASLVRHPGRIPVGIAVVLAVAVLAIVIGRKPAPDSAQHSAASRNYQRGKYFFNQFTPSSLKTAISYFEQAISDDPSFARGYAALAESYVISPQLLAASPQQVLSKIRVAAAKALQLDPRLGEAHFDLAVCAEYEFDWSTAEREFKKGLQLSPDSALGHLWYAKYLALNGRRDEVLTHRRIAAELDPVSPYALQSVAGYYSVVGHYDQAIDLFHQALAIEPRFGLSHQGLGVAYLYKGMYREAIAELKQAENLMGGPKRKALLGYAYAIAGEKEEARRILDELLGDSRRGPFPALPVAQVYIGLGEKDAAFEWLGKAVDQRDLDLTLRWDSPYEVLRADPRYVNLLRRMKLG